MSLYSSSHLDEAYNLEVIREAIAIGGLAFSPGAKSLGMTDPNNPAHVQAFIDKMRLDKQWPEKFIRERANASHRMTGMLGSFDNSVHNLMKAGDAEIRKGLIKSALEASVALGVMIDSRAFVRRGADGTEKQSAHVIGVHCVGVLAREPANPLLHVHFNFYNYGVNGKGEVNSLDTRPFHAPDKILSVVFQNLFAMHVEKNLGVRVEIEPKYGMARIVGVPVERETNRREMAKEYLKKEGVEESPLAMAYAFRNTRPPKEKIESVNFDERFEKWNEAAEKVEPEKVREQERGLFEKVVNDLLVLPVKVFAAAWTASKDRELVVVNDVKEFVKDAKPVSLAQRHKAAIKAVRRTRCDSFMDALTVAEKAFKALKPKVQLKSNTVIKVKASKIENAKQLKALEKIARINGAELRVYGKREEEKQGQKQKRGM